MVSIFLKRKAINTILILSVIMLPIYVFAEPNEYISQFVNQSNQNNSPGFRLIKTRSWPTSGCLLDSGKQIVNPGESTTLKIKNDPKCNESGIGYSIYRAEDTKNENLLGYVSHRFADGKFSLQISRFCQPGKCVFTDLSPEQNR